jgi:hypothetical protein
MAAEGGPGRPGTGTGTGTGYSGRPLSAKWSTVSNMNSTQAMLIGAVHELEEKKLLDEQIVSTVKTLILEENHEVIKLLNSHIAHILDERELCVRLRRLSDRMSPYFERPLSPLPRKDSLLGFVNSIARTYMRGKEDIALLQRLVERENEFVLSAFEVFKSDKDQENFLDTLHRIVAKYSRLDSSKNPLTPAPFYDNPSLARPESRGPLRPVAENKKEFPPSSESDTVPPCPEPRQRHKPGRDDHPKTREKLEQPTVPAADERHKVTLNDFEAAGILSEVDDDVAGTLRWALGHHEVRLQFAFEAYKLYEDSKLLRSSISSLCAKLFSDALSEHLTSEQVQRFRELQRAHDLRLLPALQQYRQDGNLSQLTSIIARLAAEETQRTEPAKQMGRLTLSRMMSGGLDDQTPNHANDANDANDGNDGNDANEPPELPPQANPSREEQAKQAAVTLTMRRAEPKDAEESDESEVSGVEDNEENKEELEVDETETETENGLVLGILNNLEVAGHISSNDVTSIFELYKQGKPDVTAAIQAFKADHVLGKLGSNLAPFTERMLAKPAPDKAAKKKKKKKFKTFQECIEFFKVRFKS